MKKVITLNKPIGKTPLEIIQDFKNNNKEYYNSKLAYAGRLDPMAHGLLVILVEEECQKRDFYQNLTKEYEFDVLFGFESDTNDILGITREHAYNSTLIFDNLNESFLTLIKNFRGKRMQKYPEYSSFRINNKPLFWWARNNRLDEIQIPEKEIEIFSFKFLKKQNIQKDELKKEILRKIRLVKGDFRQAEIINNWENVLRSSKQTNYFIFKFNVEVSSGTYIRELVREMGNYLKTKAIAWDIKRTRVGEFLLKK